MEKKIKFTCEHDLGIEYESYEEALKESVAHTRREILSNLVDEDSNQYGEERDYWLRTDVSPSDLSESAALLQQALDGGFVLEVEHLYKKTVKKASKGIGN